MVYNCRDRYEPGTGGAPLNPTGAGPDDNARDGRRDRKLPVIFTLVLALAAALVLAGCGAGGGNPQPSEGGNEGEDARASGSSEPVETAELGTPSLGREDAPVVLTEYSDYQ